MGEIFIVMSEPTIKLRR